MTMYRRYYGTFRDRNDVLYRADIYEEAATAYTPEEVQLHKDALTIEWSKKDKLDPLRTSAATLKILCWNDRKFVDLYTVGIKKVRLDVYRAGSLYWSGTISTENYEEPYYTDHGYVVTLSFCDFNVLGRQKYTLTGFQTINSVITYIIGKTGIIYNSIVFRVSTKLSSADTGVLFDEICLTSDNFTDEDDEVDKLDDVTSYILQPFGLHMIQKAGCVYIFDINAVSQDTARKVSWVRKDSSLTSDRIYNDAKITFSPYAKKEIMNAEVTEEDWDEDLVTGETGVLVYTDRSKEAEGFRIEFAQNKSDAFSIAVSTAKFFLLKSIYSGADSRGIMTTFKPDTSEYGAAAASCMTSGSCNSTELFRVTDKPYVGHTSGKYLLKVTLDILFDVRYNPFEQDSLENEEGNYDEMKNWCNFAYIPIKLTLRDSAGTALYHYQNRLCVTSSTYAILTGWESGEASWGDAWMCYYDTTDRKSSTGLGGWTANKQAIGWYHKGLPDRITKRGDGEYITMPPVAGWLELVVGTGMYQFDNDDKTEKDIYTECRYMLYKDAKIELVDQYGNDLNLKDQITKAWLNREAENGYEIETHMGTMPKAAPTSRGVFFLTSDKSIVSSFSRNSFTDTLERLFCGTMYSQFADAKSKLTGTVELIPSQTLVSDGNIGGSYMITSELQDLAASTSEINAVKVEADNYSGVEFES